LESQGASNERRARRLGKFRVKGVGFSKSIHIYCSEREGEVAKRGA